MGIAANGRTQYSKKHRDKLAENDRFYICTRCKTTRSTTPKICDKCRKEEKDK